MRKYALMLLILFCLLFYGCSTIKLPELTKEEVASICVVDVNKLEVITGSNSMEFKMQKSQYVSQSLWIEVGPTSKKNFDQIKQVQSNSNLTEYPEVGDGALIYTKQIVFRTMLVIDGKHTYRIYSLIDGCKSDAKLIEIANKILQK
jgi:hypothetical protein